MLSKKPKESRIIMEDRQELYKRFLNRECSPEEAEELLAYFLTPEGERDLSELIESRLADAVDVGKLTSLDHDAIAKVESNIERLSVRSDKRLRKWLPYAAAVLLFALGLSGLLLDRYLSVEALHEEQIDLVSEDILPGGNQATLQLSDGRTIVLDGKQGRLLFGEDSITYADGVTRVIADDLSDSYVASDTLTLTTPKGGTYQVTLSDGSRIWLNAETTLKYPAKFNRGERVVSLMGEAFFDVAAQFDKEDTKQSLLSKKRVPFKVISKGQEVAVLGTQFNISAYKDRKQTYTTLVEGKVRVDISKNQLGNTAAKKSSMLLPGQQAIVGEHRMDVKSVATESYIAWKEGLFHFDDALPEDAVIALARWYDLDVEYRGKVPELRIFGVLDRNKPLSAVLKSLEKSGLTFKVVRSGGRHKLIILGEEK